MENTPFFFLNGTSNFLTLNPNFFCVKYLKELIVLNNAYLSMRSWYVSGNIHDMEA